MFEDAIVEHGCLIDKFGIDPLERNSLGWFRIGEKKVITSSDFNFKTAQNITRCVNIDTHVGIGTGRDEICPVIFER